MEKKEEKRGKTDRAARDQPLTVMAIQEILGLFTPKSEPEEGQEAHDYLKNKPLGLI